MISDADEFADEFGVFFREVGPYLSRFNIAPTQQTLVLAGHDHFQTSATAATPDEPFACLPMKWGLVPSWSKDPAIGARMINARSETVAEKPAFRAAFKRRRCLVPASGFYEWKKPPETDKKAPKQPYYIHRAGDGLMTLAGLWEEWSSNDGEIIVSFTILTTTPNATMKPLHDRMPVIIAPDDRDRWINAENRDDVADLLQPFADDYLAAYPVSTIVNNARNEDPRCVEPV